jgi:hypothetical protein
LLGAYASVALVCAGSLLVGQAILSLCGRRELTWLAGPVGLAALLVASGLAIKLPGHGTAVAITVGALVVAAVIVLVLGRSALARAPASYAGLAVVAALLALLVASIPFIANERVGILGVGLVNDDMAYHLWIADWLNTHIGEMPVLIDQGYPVGPHALVAGLSEALGTGLVEAFAGLTLAIPVLTAFVAFEALRGLRPGPRVAAAVLVAVPYLVAAYLAQEAFKEPIEALFLLSFALLLPSTSSPSEPGMASAGETSPGARQERARLVLSRAIPLGVIAAGATYTYSFPGLFWLGAAAAIYVAIQLVRGVPGSRTASLWAGAAAVGVVAILTAPEWTRMIDFGDFRAFRTSNLSGGLGNLRHQLSPLEALGIWPTSEFRLAASDSSHPVAFWVGAAIAAAAVGVGLPRWVKRHGAAIPAALGAAILGYVGALLFGTVYTSAKALAIAAPLIALVAFGGLLDRDLQPARSWFAAGLAILLAAGMALSSFLVLRQAPVGPTDHAEQLAELRPLVQGEDVLFLGRDNFISYELRGATPFTAVRNFYDPNYVKPDLRLKDVFRKFDFDSVKPATLDRFPFVITTRAAYASGPPPNFERVPEGERARKQPRPPSGTGAAAFEPVRETDDFVLWKRVGPVGPRRTLAEGDSPGVELDCPAGAIAGLPARGRATIFAEPPAVGGTWSPSSTVEDGAPVTQTLELPAGRWEISLQYDATRPLQVSAPDFAATLPANLDYRGSVPYYPAGELTVRRKGPVRFTVAVDDPPTMGRLLGTKSQAHLGAIAASPAAGEGPIPGEAERVIPTDRACGRYVDFYAATARH